MRHRRARSSVSGGARLFGAVTGILALTLATGCSASATWRQPGSANAGSPSSPAAGASALTVKPAANAKNVKPVDGIKAEITNGTLTEVSLKNSAGKTVLGEFANERSSWQPSEALGYNKSYTLKVIADGLDGKHYEETSKFTTVQPKNLTMPYLRANYGILLDKGTFGVGQPVTVWFDEPIKNKVAAQKALSITTDPPVEGAWHWFDDREVHWRPKVYWPAGTTVKVEANVYGRDLGGGLYGQQDVSASFKIGRSHIAVADAKTHRMKIYIDGKQLKTINGHNVTKGIPVSLGKDGTTTGANGELIDFRTYSGPHVVMLKFESFRMTSASFGITNKNDPNYYDSLIQKAVRISNSGEFFHLADWNIPQHGHENTSHGCINVGPDYIYWMYKTFIPGDVVDVRNTGKTLDPRDGLGDFVLSWDKWIKGSAIPYVPPVEPTPTPDPSASASPSPYPSPTG